MESVIGEYSSYQAALRAHNLECHVIAVWANTHGTENAAFSLLKGVWLRCRLLLTRYLQWSWCHHLSRQPLQGKTKGRGWTCWGRTRRCRDCLCRTNTFLHYCHSQRLHNSEVCFKPADREGTTRSFSVAAKTKAAAALTSIRTNTTDYLIAADTGCLSGATNMISWDRDGVNQPCATLIRGAGM